MQNKRTEISEVGEFGLIRRLTDRFPIRNASTVMGAGDDAAVIDAGDKYLLLTSDLLLEGIDFDLVYFPLKHLGYKAVVVGINDILAMNGTPEQLTVAIGVSAKFAIEDLEELYSGIRSACEDYKVDLVGGDTDSSVTGLTIAVSVVGSVEKERIVYRSGAKENDLVCITGDLGAAYMGLHLLEREKRAFAGNDNPQPQFEGYEYLLRRQLMPSAPTTAIAAMLKRCFRVIFSTLRSAALFLARPRGENRGGRGDTPFRVSRSGSRQPDGGDASCASRCLPSARRQSPERR